MNNLTNTQDTLDKESYAKTSELISFLLRPSDAHDSVERALTSAAIEELHSLDVYLSAHAGDGWEEGKVRHGLKLQADSWSALWPTRAAARLLLIEREKGNPSWPWILNSGNDLLSLRSFDAGSAGFLNIVTCGAFLDFELTRTFHPSAAGARVFCENPSGFRFDELVNRYRTALDFLAKYDPVGFSVFIRSVTAIAPLGLDPQLEAGKSFSMAIGTAPGLVLLTVTPVVLLAETLLHESAHNRLSAVDGIKRLWRSGSVRVKSPLRSDARPISGLYHQAYVLFQLCRYHALLRETSGDIAIEKNRRQIDKRIAEFTCGLHAAIETLQANERELTSFGLMVLDAMVPREGE